MRTILGLRLPEPGDDPTGTASLGRGALGDFRLWADVVVVVMLAEAWQLGVIAVGQGFTPSVNNFVALGLFLIPVLYAAITFGSLGGMVVASTAALMVLPWAIISDRQGNTAGAWSDLIQVVSLFVVAYFVGRAVSAQRLGRLATETARQAHLRAEARYRDLFDTNSEPIVLLDPTDRILEANAAAQALLDRAGLDVPSASLADLVGPEGAAAIVAEAGDEPPLAQIPVGTEGARLYQPALSTTEEVDGRPIRQLVLRDVTDEARRRRRAEVYAADVILGQEDERRRIAQELHDGPLQSLLHLRRLLAQAAPWRSGNGAGPVAPQGSAGAEPPLAEIDRLARSVAEELRGISHGLRPPLLDDLGFEAALRLLCDDAEQRHGIAVSAQVAGDVGRLSPLVELVLYRIAQEALSNAGRHARASTAGVTLAVSGDRVRLAVTDDGSGFVAPDRGEGDQGGLGLQGMAERAELVGGRLDIRSSPEGGTTVTVEAPCDGPRTPRTAPSAPGAPRDGWIHA